MSVQTLTAVLAQEVELQATADNDHALDVEYLQRLIRQGAQAAAVDASAPFAALCLPSLSYDDLSRSKIARVLIDAGANPLLLPGAVFANTMRSDEGDFRGVVCAALAAREVAGDPCRARDGGNLLHVLGSLWPGALQAVFHGMEPERRAHRQWVSEARASDGATPLHLPWSMLHDVYTDTSGYYPTQAMVSDYPIRMRDLTTQMLSYGADLFVPDHQGKRVFDWIQACLATKPYSVGATAADRSSWSKLLAYAQTQHLNATVSVAPAARSAGPRL